MPDPRPDHPPRCSSERERKLLQRMCERAEVEFTEWECARLLTEFKRNLDESQWVSLRADPSLTDPVKALRALIVLGFENRRLARIRGRGRKREGVWAQQAQQQRRARMRKPGRR